MKMESRHTPGPLKVGNCDLYVEGDASSDHDDIVIAALGQAGSFRSHEYSVIKGHKPEGKANARLLAAAYTSYDKHCGPRAIECAEGDLLGEALEACRKAEALIKDMSRFVGQMALRDYAAFNEAPMALRAVLAKAGGAS